MYIIHDNNKIITRHSDVMDMVQTKKFSEKETLVPE